MKRWLVYLAVLAVSVALFGAVPVWATWIFMLTAAGSPLFSVAIGMLFSMPQDCWGLFRFSAEKSQAEYVQELRLYRLGDNLSRVHWKLSGKTGAWMVRKEVLQAPKLPKRRRILGMAPVLLAFAVFICIFPPHRYSQQMGKLQRLFLRRQEKTVIFDLTEGPQSQSKQAVMDVVATKSQLLYLRGQAFDSYNGQSWTASNGEEEHWQPRDGAQASTVRISTRMVLPVRYVPYYAAEELEFYMGAVQNTEKLQTYTYTQSRNMTASDDLPAQCLALPAQTKSWAEKTLQTILGSEALSASKKAMRIQAFVRSCAVYDANPPAMSDNGDFATWFVEECDRGYCVHFATTAAVLLRGAGIPARFVTGYVVNVQAGVRKTVTGQDAHAWVEYFDGGVWRILEATPTVEAVPLQEISLKEEKHRIAPVLWMALGFLMLLWRRKGRKLEENPRIKELRQKAAFSREGLSEEEKREYEKLRRFLWHGCFPCLPLWGRRSGKRLTGEGYPLSQKSKIFASSPRGRAKKAHTFLSSRKAKAERKGRKVKQEEKKPITWEVADPKPPVVQSGKMENRKQN